MNLLRLGSPVIDSEGKVVDVNSKHDFLLAPSGYPALIWTENDKREQSNLDSVELIPTQSITSFISAIDGNIDDFEDEQEMEMVRSIYNDLHFSPELVSTYGKAWKEMNQNGMSEETFVMNLLKTTFNHKDGCGCVMGDCCDYQRLFLVYEIEVSDAGFDSEKLDFFNVDTDLNCCCDIQEAFNQDVIFLDAIIYDGKVYKAYTGEDRLVPNAGLPTVLNPETLQEED